MENTEIFDGVQTENLKIDLSTFDWRYSKISRNQRYLHSH